MPVIFLIIIYLLLFSFSCFLLIKTGSWTVQSLIKIGQFLRWKEFIVSFIIMAFATTLPELFVGISSALNKLPEISLNNVLGSNIINLSLAIGLLVLLYGKNLGITQKSAIKTNSIYLLLIGLLPIFLILDKNLSRIDGGILFITAIFYLSRLISQEKKHTKPMPNSIPFKVFLKDIFIFSLSILFLLIAAQGVTYSAINLAKLSKISLGIIGLIVIALSTNLPELVFGIKAVRLGRPYLALGDFIGASVINCTSVLGITAIIYPISVNSLSPYITSMIFFILNIIILNIFVRTKEQISKKEAIFLICFYILFLILTIKSIV